jgi:hypothetical protein
MEDIIFTRTETKKQRRLNFLMQKACGEGRIYIWIPIKFTWPIVGERVFDWCWKE